MHCSVRIDKLSVYGKGVKIFCRRLQAMLRCQLYLVTTKPIAMDHFSEFTRRSTPEIDEKKCHYTPVSLWSAIPLVLKAIWWITMGKSVIYIPYLRINCLSCYAEKLSHGIPLYFDARSFESGPGKHTPNVCTADTRYTV